MHRQEHPETMRGARRSRRKAPEDSSMTPLSRSNIIAFSLPLFLGFSQKSTPRPSQGNTSADRLEHRFTHYRFSGSARRVA